MKKASKSLHFIGLILFIVGTGYNIVELITEITKVISADFTIPPRFTVESFLYEIISIIVLVVASAIIILLSVRNIKRESASKGARVFYLLSFIAELFMALPQGVKYLIIVFALTPIQWTGLSLPIVPFLYTLASGALFRVIGSALLFTSAAINVASNKREQADE